MSLVAYAASSDEESDYDDDTTEAQVAAVIPSKTTVSKPAVEPTNESTTGHISDDDDDDSVYPQEEFSLQDLAKVGTSKFSLSLPKPKTQSNEELDLLITPTFAKLPMPRSAVATNNVVIEEEDDEFLHKKAVPIDKDALEKPPPPPPAVKARVKISIPSLKEFSDVDKELTDKTTKMGKTHQPRGCGLLSILPKPKSELNFAKQSPVVSEGTVKSNTVSSNATAPVRPAFVPDTVRNQRPAHNTEGVDGIKNFAKKPQKTNPKEQTSKPTLIDASDSDASDDETSGGDFFSLNAEVKLPAVSENEISALVAKRAAQIVETSTKYLIEKEAQEAAEAERLQAADEEQRQAQKRYHEQHLNAEAMDALVGKNAKRRRKEQQEIQVIDINGSEVLPDREEWMRTALASSTVYQPTGVLNDDEPAAGTRRKHQITYLAHKAKSNEAELQAMWSANRQNRRATQSKYGF